MRKILLMGILLVLMSGIAAAQGPSGIHEPGTGIENPELREAGQGTGQGLQNETQQMLISQQQTRLMAGEFVSEDGQQLQVQQQSGTRMQLKVRNVSAHTEMELVQERVQNRTRLTTKLSNGMGAEIKVMPDTASERAIERLRLKVCSSENNCTIQLKEVGQGNQTRAAYEVQADKESRVLGLFRKKMHVQAQVDAETGEVIQAKKPWWAFVASE